jgi:hypothetical protein
MYELYLILVSINQIRDSLAIFLFSFVYNSNLASIHIAK